MGEQPSPQDNRTGRGLPTIIGGNAPAPPSPFDNQAQLEYETGLSLKGTLGGLPVAEQNQEYFAVFDEAGDAGPELIDKTQFRITYLVDSQLNTSKPATDTDSALNATQNFGKGKPVIVRADNATVLNQNLSGEQLTYDVGTLRLISTTETGSQPTAYSETSSFSNISGQDIITDAQNISARFTATHIDNPNLITDGTNSPVDPVDILFLTASEPFISQSDPGGGLQDEWITFNSNKEIEFLQSTYTAGTRVQIDTSVYFKKGDEAPFSKVKMFCLINDEIVQEVEKTLFDTTWTPIQIRLPYKNYSTGDTIKFQAQQTYNTIYDTTTFPDYAVKIVAGNFVVRQEYAPGDVYILGVNAAYSPYFEPYYSTSTGSLLTGDGGYSILTASLGFTPFLNGNYVFRLHPDSETWDPTQTDSTFNPIIEPFTFKVGDEIRFEYNKNKVHKIVESVAQDDGRYYLTVSPFIESQSVVDHFTHYRIVPDGGYLIANVKKDNKVDEFQPFSGIILPQYPSEALQERSDRLIYELKQANIIEK